jgi:hypothetical protein
MILQIANKTPVLTTASKDEMQLWFALAAAFVLLALVALVRKNKLKASYSLLWFGGWALCSFFIAFPGALDFISDGMGIGYSPTLLVLMMIMSLGLITLHFTIVITRQSKHINLLTQEMALLKEKMSCPD